MDSMHSANKKLQIKWRGQAGSKHLGNGSAVIDCGRLSDADLEIKA